MILKINTKGYLDCTIGRLSYDHFNCFTLELPWRENKTDISCIGAGAYECEKYFSPKHGLVILFKNVLSREMIEIHAGNFTSQILGCILVGDSIKHLNGDAIPDVTNSKNTLANLLECLPNEFITEIIRS